MIIILCGPVHGGKTTFLERMSRRWRDEGLRLRGFLSPSLWEGGERKGYDLLELGESRSRPFLRTSGEDGWERVGPFYLVPETLEHGQEIIRRASPDELLIIDEIGPLELEGGGLWPALENMLTKPAVRTILVVREEVLGEFLALLAAHRPVKIDIREEDAGIRLERLVAGTAGRT